MSAATAATMKGVMAHVITATKLCILSAKMIPLLNSMTNSFEMLPRAQRLRCDRNTLRLVGTMVNALARRAWAVRFLGKRLKMMAAWILSSE